ncbi:hypothetical protein [Labedaea rhizosphaerae]|uniref:Uncharacterized protein n=1 Tax=Labedaea rhizosphaerae TaxID=598644 RepID=A0A4R6S9U9_LABRH|nr:hypothetical protein [Labedaea rhizosphaerae]TDP96157.1 hypothetical protein EV186_104139 [Labedaea rhizosphaerae]
MRLLRIGDEPSRIGADVSAALTSWGRGDGVVGGFALVGAQPPGCPGPVDAVVVLPRGVLVVAGVDLPDPAMRLDAPLAGAWKTDGWPLVRPGDDAATNPAAEAIEASTAIANLLQSNRAEPVPVGTVVAVGPYVEKVEQPTADLVRGVRILHPEPMTLLTATRELAVRERPCTVREAHVILAALAPDLRLPMDEELTAEGFPTASDMASASTTLIPRFRDADKPKRPAKPKSGGGIRWLPIAAVALIGVLLLTGIIVAVASAGGDPAPTPAPTRAGAKTSAPTSAPAKPARTDANAMPGLSDGDFVAKDTTQDADCAADTTGDMQAWLQQHGCDRLLRARYVVAVNGKQAAVLLAVLSFPDNATAASFKVVADTPGSGTVLDPAAQGKPWPQALKPSFDSAGYGSQANGTSVVIAQTTWVKTPPKPDDEALDALARRAAQLPPPQ